MNEHVQSEVFLQFDHRSDLSFHGLPVFLVGKVASYVSRTGLPNLCGLRERTNSCGRYRGQVECFVLEFTAGFTVCPFRVVFSDGGGASPHVFPHHSGEGSTQGDRFVRGRQRVFD